MAVDFCAKYLTHVKGEWAGRPLILESWESEFVRNLFGWKRPDGTRKYRKALLFIARKNGKTLLGAAIALYLLFADKEPGAEIYSVAADRDQAAIMFDTARGMVEGNQALASRCEVYRRAIVVPSTGSAYHVLSADAPSKHGKNAHGVLFDELHAQANRELYDVMKTSQGARKQPLFLMFTTAGFDRKSVCWEEYEYACKVRDGIIKDDTYLPVIFEAHAQPYTEKVQSLTAVERLDIMCSCKNVTSIQIEKCLRKVCANHAMTVSSDKRKNCDRKDAESTQTDQLEQKDYVQHVTNSPYSTQTQNINAEQFSSAQSGQPEINPESVQPMLDGGRSRKVSSTWQNGGEPRNMASVDRNTSGSRTNKADVAQSVEWKQFLSSIIVTIQKKSEDSSALSATLESVFSETLKKLYFLHSNTCSVRNVKLDGSSILIDHDADDWTDPEIWRKANPNLGISPKIEFLVDECNRAKESAAYQNTFRRLYLNQWTEQETRWIDIEKWEACNEHFDPDSLRGRRCIIGLDLASTTDIAAECLLFPPDDLEGIYLAMWRFWIPEENMRRRSLKDRVPYVEWHKAGFIDATEGNVVDQNFIKAQIIEDCETYDVQEIAYDRWNATKLVTELVDEGLTMVPVGQGFQSMAAPTKEWEKLILGKRIAHNGNPVAKWMMSNVAVRQDPAGNLKPDKAKSTEKIDGIVAGIMALGRAMVSESTGSVYNNPSEEVWA